MNIPDQSTDLSPTEQVCLLLKCLFGSQLAATVHNSSYSWVREDLRESQV